MSESEREGIQVEQLMGLLLLEGMPEDMKRRVGEVFLSVSDEALLEYDEELMHEGYLAFESGYVLASGTVRIERGGETLSDLEAPALLGEMSQFKSSDTRSATVRALGPVAALHFHWEDFYEQAKEDLPPEAYQALMRAIEVLVWDRFGHKEILDIPLLRDLSEQQRLDTCMVFPWITELGKYEAGDLIFEQEERCQMRGFLLVKGRVKLSRGPGKEIFYEAPHLIGVMPKPDPALLWTATASAEEGVEVLSFSWNSYTRKLDRLSKDDQRAFVASMKAHAGEHFWH